MSGTLLISSSSEFSCNTLPNHENFHVSEKEPPALNRNSDFTSEIEINEYSKKLLSLISAIHKTENYENFTIKIISKREDNIKIEEKTINKMIVSDLDIHTDLQKLLDIFQKNPEETPSELKLGRKYIADMDYKNNQDEKDVEELCKNIGYKFINNQNLMSTLKKEIVFTNTVVQTIKISMGAIVSSILMIVFIATNFCTAVSLYLPGMIFFISLAMLKSKPSLRDAQEKKYKMQSLLPHLKDIEENLNQCREIYKTVIGPNTADIIFPCRICA